MSLWHDWDSQSNLKTTINCIALNAISGEMCWLSVLTLSIFSRPHVNIPDKKALQIQGITSNFSRQCSWSIHRTSSDLQKVPSDRLSRDPNIFLHRQVCIVNLLWNVLARGRVGEGGVGWGGGWESWTGNERKTCWWLEAVNTPVTIQVLHFSSCCFHLIGLDMPD